MNLLLTSVLSSRSRLY